MRNDWVMKYKPGVHFVLTMKAVVLTAGKYRNEEISARHKISKMIYTALATAFKIKCWVLSRRRLSKMGFMEHRCIYITNVMPNVCLYSGNLKTNY